MHKISALKQKKFCPKKKLTKQYGQNSSFLDQQMAPYGAIFSQGFGYIPAPLPVL